MCVWSFASRSKPEKKASVYKLRQKAPRSLCAAYYTVSLHECTPVRRNGTLGNETQF